MVDAPHTSYDACVVSLVGRARSWVLQGLEFEANRPAPPSAQRKHKKPPTATRHSTKAQEWTMENLNKSRTLAHAAN